MRMYLQALCNTAISQMTSSLPFFCFLFCLHTLPSPSICWQRGPREMQYPLVLSPRASSHLNPGASASFPLHVAAACRGCLGNGPVCNQTAMAAHSQGAHRQGQGQGCLKEVLYLGGNTAVAAFLIPRRRPCNKIRRSVVLPWKIRRCGRLHQPFLTFPFSLFSLSM